MTIIGKTTCKFCGEAKGLALAVAERAYVAILKVRDESWLLKNQQLYCELRDFIAEHGGRDTQEVQESYEEQALRERLEEGFKRGDKVMIQGRAGIVQIVSSSGQYIGLVDHVNGRKLWDVDDVEHA